MHININMNNNNVINCNNMCIHFHIQINMNFHIHIKIAQTRPRERGSGQLDDGGSPNGIPSHVLPQSKFLTHLFNIIIQSAGHQEPPRRRRRRRRHLRRDSRVAAVQHLPTYISMCDECFWRWAFFAWTCFLDAGNGPSWWLRISISKKQNPRYGMPDANGFVIGQRRNTIFP